MRARTGIAKVLLVCAALSLAGCDTSESRRLPGGPSSIPPPSPSPPPPPPTPFPVEGYTLTSSPEMVSPGAELSVSWTAPKGGKLDWIGIFLVGARNCDHGDYWYTDNQTSGTLTVKAPSKPGQYEFRYHLDDGCAETVRSNPVTVTAGV
jgi:hypothetical protein